MLWQVYNGGSVDTVANEAITIDDSKYSVSKNTSSGKYYRLNIKNVEASDAKKYSCSGVIKTFYLQLDLLGRCNYRHKNMVQQLGVIIYCSVFSDRRPIWLLQMPKPPVKCHKVKKI
jgi:hypothetical protein